MTKTMNLSQKLNKLADSRVLLFVLWLVLVLFRLPFVDKGIDYTDTGFSLTNYMEAFGGIGIDGIGTFLTKITGGIIYEILPSHQLLIFRMMYWVMLVLIDVCTYLIFRKFLKPVYILISLIAYGFLSIGGEMLYSYYPLTKLILVVAIGLMLYSLKSNKNIWMFISGLLCGVNVFVRLPNVLFCSLIFCIIAYGVWAKTEKKIIIKQALWYFVGAVGGCLLVLLAMISYMGFDQVVSSLMSFVNMALGTTGSDFVNFLGIEEAGGHSIFDSVKVVVYQAFIAVKHMVIFGVPMLVVAFLFGKLRKVGNRFVCALSTVLLLIAEVAIIVLFKSNFGRSLMYIQAVCTLAVSLFMIFAMKGRAPHHRLMYLITFVLGVLSVFGSDLGLNRLNMLQGFLPLILVLALFDMSTLPMFDKSRKVSHFVYRNIICVTFVLIILMELVVGTTVKMQTAYMDGKYSDLNVQVDSRITVLNGMKTTQSRADALNEYYEVMSAPQLKDSEVAIFGYFPLGYVIGEQNDYFAQVQPCVDYPAVSVVKLLKVIEVKQEEQIYPIIVVSHINANQRGDEHDTSDAKYAVIDYMLSLTDYEVYVDDENFLIYVPKGIMG